jgi:hypothetical protein
MPIINGATYVEGDKAELDLAGRNFRSGELEVWVDDAFLKKLQYVDKYFTGNGTYKHVSSFDKKLNKRLPDRTWVKVVVKQPRTGQVSPAFDFRRKRPLS